MLVTKKEVPKVNINEIIKVHDRMVSSNSGDSMNRTYHKINTHSPFHHEFLKTLQGDNKEEIETLVRRFTIGRNKERDRILWDNIWLVPYLSRPYRSFMDVDDLHCSGIIGLIKGIKKLDKDKLNSGIKPSTYLRHWILSEIRETLYKNRNVVVPKNRIQDQVKKNNSSNEDSFYKEDFVYPEIALDHLSNNNEEKGEIKDWYLYHNNDNGFIEPHEKDFEENQWTEKIQELFNTSERLTKEERKILIHRFGLKTQEDNYEKPKTLRQIGAITGMTYENVRKIEMKALKKLQSTFKDLYDEVTD